jgi:hypothetical protein
MSICRWSSDNWNSDVYIYEDVGGGFTTHVANVRHVGPVPPVDYGLLEKGEIEAFVAQHNAQMEWLGQAERVKIGGPFDGAMFNDRTVEDLRARVLELAVAGYRVPLSVLDELESYETA